MIHQSASVLQTSLETLRQINWHDDIRQVPNDIDQKLLDQCSELIQEFLEEKQLSRKKQNQSKAKRKKQESKGKKFTRKKRKKISRSKIKKKTPMSKLSKIASTDEYQLIYPCFRPSGPIKCPKNKLPMPRDLWYRIVYSQALEQQFDNNRRKQTVSTSSKRKHQEDSLNAENLSKNRSTSTNPRQQQTMNAVMSSISTKMMKFEEQIDDYLQKSERCVEKSPTELSNPYPAFPKETLEYIAETLPLESECPTNGSNPTNTKADSKQNLKPTLWTLNLDRMIPSTQSAHIELVNRPKIYRGISADATLERQNPLTTTLKNESNPSTENISILDAPSTSILLDVERPRADTTTTTIQNPPSHVSIQEPTSKITDENLSTTIAIQFDHPLINQLFDYYHLEDIPREQLFKQLNRRLKHIRQSLKRMSSNDMELKLKYKRDALAKKRQTPVQSLTKDERIAMTELELNVYEYVRALDEPSSKSFHVSDHDVLQPEPVLSIPSVLPLYDSLGPMVTSSMMASESSIEPSLSTLDTIQPSPISQSTARLSTITQFSEKTEKLNLWTHPLEADLLSRFEPLTPHLKARIRKQLARRCEHIRKKAQQLNRTQLETQIDSKSKALEQTKSIHQPNKTELLRIAELELSLFELRQEQVQRRYISQ